jgi:acetyltransferase EpsM
MKKIVIIGGRGNGTVIASTIEDCKDSGQDISCVGFLNDNEKSIDGYPVLGGIRNKDWLKLPDDYLFIYAMSKVKKALDIHNLLKKLKIPIERFANIIHPTAVVSKQFTIGKGVVIMPHTIVSPGVKMGNHSQLYAMGFIGHDSTIGEMTFLSANSHTGGNVTVGDGAHIGIMSTSIENVVIGEYSVVGAGAIILKNVAPFNVVVGNPAKVINCLK